MLKTMEMGALKYFTLFIIVASAVVPGHCQEWTEMSIDIRRTIGSAISASEFLGGTYVGMSKAFAEANVAWDRYFVFFFASFPSSGGDIRMCKARVLWAFESPSMRTVELARCGL